MAKTATIIGAGLIGRSWAMVFARAGWRVNLHDAVSAQLDAARAFIASSLDEQASHGLVNDAAAARARIAYVPDLGEAVSAADWVQENTPETLPDKQRTFAVLDREAPASERARNEILGPLRIRLR